MIRALLPIVLGFVLITNVYFAHSDPIQINSSYFQNDTSGNGFLTLKSRLVAQTESAIVQEESPVEERGPNEPSSVSRNINYMVREGDSLDSIAKRFRLSVNEIVALNGLEENSKIRPGQFLKIPLKVRRPNVEVVRDKEHDEKEEEQTTKKVPVVKEKEPLTEDSTDRAKEDRIATEGGDKVLEEHKKSQTTVDDEIVNLQTEMDLRDLIQTMSEITGETFLLEDTVKGKMVTIITPQGGFKKQNALRLFETILDLNGFSIVKKDSINKIIQKRDIKTESIPTEVGTQYREPSDRFITRLVPIENIQASEVANTLKPLISKEGDIAVYPELNTLIIVETVSNLNRILKIIEYLDLEKEIEFVKIENTDAAEVAAKLVDIFGGTGTITTARSTTQPTGQSSRTRRTQAARRTQPTRTASSSGQSNLGGFRVIVDDRTNSLIIIAYPEDMPKINAIIKRLDTEVEEPEEGIYVIRLQNADAEQLVGVISSLFGGGGVGTATRGAGRRRTTGLGTTTRESIGQGLGDGQARQAISRQSTIGGGISTVIAITDEEIRMTADPSTNSVIIVSSRKAYEFISRVIEDLDVRRKQVFVEAAILEVSVDNITSIGSALTFGFTFNDGKDLGFGGSVPPGVPSLLGIAADPTQTINLASTLSGLFLGLIGEEVDPDGSGPIPPIPSFSALIQALTTLTDVNVLSTPSIITTDNEEAEIVVADVIPFPTGSVIGDAGVTVQTIDRQPVGIRLAITPQISEGDYLNLNIFTEVSRVSPAPPDLNTAEFGIATTTRTADSSVVVKNGQTIVIGGLVQDQENISISRVPLLGRIPVLGNLFKFKSVQHRKINLMILITPTIIESEWDMQTILEQRQRRNMLIQQKSSEDRGTF